MKRLSVVLEMIKVEHTIFALPFAYLGAFLAARGFPGWWSCLWILAAMVGARSAAMAFNRLADHTIDARNPRTSNRALPAGLVDRTFVMVFVTLSVALFFASAWMLNPLALALSPVALAIVLAYSYTKRFTALSHLVLGLSLGIAPVGGWVAVRGSLDWPPFLIAAAVIFWVGGFDIIYSCQDLEFDRAHGLQSIPARLGVRRALRLAGVFHVVMVGILLIAFAQFGLSTLSWIGLATVVTTLAYEHRLVWPADLSRVNMAFFTLNGIVSVVLFIFVGLDLCLLD